MTDEIDIANDLAERERESIAAQRVSHMDGPLHCLRCGGENDNRFDGLGACSDCIDPVCEGCE